MEMTDMLRKEKYLTLTPHSKQLENFLVLITRHMHLVSYANINTQVTENLHNCQQIAKMGTMQQNVDFICINRTGTGKQKSEDREQMEHI